MVFISCFMLGSHHVAWTDLDLSILVFCSVLVFFFNFTFKFYFCEKAARAEARGWGDECGIGMHDVKSTINEKF